MKKTLTALVAVLLLATLCMSMSGCKLIFPDDPVHTHSFADGKCECGETDPDYVPPHQHSFVGGVCECGEIDPNHECIFFQGKCIICLKDDPNLHYVITGDYGVITEVTVNGKVDVNTVDTKSDEFSETCPSSAKQKLLGAALVEEMKEMGIADAFQKINQEA